MANCKWLFNDGSFIALNDGISVLLMNDNSCSDTVVVAPVDLGFAPSVKLRIRNATVRGSILKLFLEFTSGKARAGAKFLGETLVNRLSLVCDGFSAGATVEPPAIFMKTQLSSGEADGFDAVGHDNNFIISDTM